MAAEVFAFGGEVIERGPFLLRHIFPASNRLYPPSAVLSYLIGNIVGALFFGVPAALIAWLVGKVFSDQAAFWVLAVVAGLLALSFAISTIMLPFQIRSGAKIRSNTRTMLEAAVRAYAELAPGSVSTVRVREVAAAAADKGVVWPNPLFLLLDENIRTSGRL